MGRGRKVAGHAPWRETVARGSPGVRREGHPHVGREPVTRDELHLVDPLLLAALVLEPDLDDTHGQARVFGQLFSHLACRFRVLIKASLEDLQLLGLDGGAGAAPLPVLSDLALLDVILVVVVLDVGRPGLPLDDQRVVAAAAAAVGGVQVKVLAGVVAGRAVAVLNVVDLAEEIALVVAAHLVALGEVGGAVPAGEALGVEQRVPDLARLVGLGEDQLAGRAPWSEHPVKVLATVKLSKLREA